MVEILYFEGCPNHDAAHALVERTAADLGLDAEIADVEVRENGVVRARFLGSPTVRVNGQDVEPGAAERTDYVFACRVYRSEEGLSGLPDVRWVRNALKGIAS